MKGGYKVKREKCGVQYGTTCMVSMIVPKFVMSKKKHITHYQMISHRRSDETISANSATPAPVNEWLIAPFPYGFPPEAPPVVPLRALAVLTKVSKFLSGVSGELIAKTMP
jgi:hypothetical protein